MTTEITEILKGYNEFSEDPYADSIKFLREYIEVEPSSEAFFELGKALFFNEDYDESIEYLKKSNDIRSDAYLGLNHYKKEDYQNAIMHFKKFLKENENETILTYLMLSHEKCSDWQNALACGKRLLEINPDNFSIKIDLIDYHFNLEQYEKSLEYLNDLKMVEKCRYKRGLVLFNLKRYQDAIDELKSLKTAKSYKLISKAYEKLDKQTKAVRYLYKAYEIDEDIETLFEISDFLFKGREYEKSIHILKEILYTDPKNEMALEKIAEAYGELHKFHHAITYCETLLEINDKNIKAYETLSNAQFFLGDIEKSVKSIEKGLKIDSKSAELWNLKAWIDYAISDFEAYVSDFEQILKLKPNTVEYYIVLIREFAFENQLDRARKYYERLMFYNPSFKMSFDEVIGDIPPNESLYPCGYYCC